MVVQPGERFERYEILSLLGRGGMGEVYVALDTRLGRKVALKLLPEQYFLDSDRVRRFEQEARAASALNHPNILTIHEVGSAEGTHFIATELVEGQTLREASARRRFTLDEALGIAMQVASGLDVAHKAGIVHRDVKPENIMLRPDGVVKLLDFGLIKLVERRAADAESPTLAADGTGAGVILGTARYMSPEQARGLEVDARTDIFSLGAVLYEMIAARSPFEGPTTSDLIAAILHIDPPPLNQFDAGVPPELEHIVQKALRKDREDRYQSVRDLLIDLRDLQKDLQVDARLERSHPEVMRRDSGRVRAGQTAAVAGSGRLFASRPARLAAVVVLAVVAAAAAVVWYSIARSGSKDRPGSVGSPSVVQLTSDAGPELFPSLSPDGKSFVYASRAAGNWDIYLQRVGGQNPTNLTRDSQASETQPAFSPDGDRVAFRSERDGGGIFVIGATGESVRRVSDFGYNPVWSPDGKLILVASESVTQPSSRPTRSQLWTIAVASGEKKMISEGDALQPHWSPNGSRIAYWGRPQGSGQGDLWTIDADGRAPVQVTREPAMDWGPVWSPDGTRLYFSSDRGGSMDVWQVAVDERSGKLFGEPTAVTVGSAASLEHLSFSEDGKQLAYAARQDVRNLKKVGFDPSTEKASGEPVSITRGSIPVGFPDPSPGGEWLTYYSTGKKQDLFVIRTDGTGQRQLTDDAHRDLWPRWSPDGQRIAFTSNRTGSSEIWAIRQDGSGLQQLSRTPGAHYGIWSSDGAHLAFSVHRPRNDGLLIRVGGAPHEQTPQAIASLPDPKVSFEIWSWSSAGTRLAGTRHLPDGSHAGVGVYDLKSRQYEWLTDFGEWPVWLTDDRRLLFASQGRIFIVDSRTKRHHEVLFVAEGDIGAAALSRDNRLMYFTFVATEADVWMMTLDGRR